MRKIPFKIPRTTVERSGEAWASDGDDVCEAIVETVIGDISTDIEIEVGGVTMHLAAWRDPYHWSEDWAEALGGVDFDDWVEGLEGA